MRPLTEPETKVVFDKLANYCSDLKSLIAPLDDGDRYVFRLNHSRVRLFFPSPKQLPADNLDPRSTTSASPSPISPPASAAMPSSA